MTIVNQLASIGMAVGPPLVYLDQYMSILRRKDSTGFSMDVCGVLIVANVIRVFFWFGKRFETALLVQSLLMIAFQLALLYVCLKYKQPSAVEEPSKNPINTGTHLLGRFSPGSKRPLDLWQWKSYGSYIEFIAALIGVNTILYLFLSGFATYIDVIGLLALGLESTLPIPQLISNFQRRSLAGFRSTVLLGWLFGDAFKTIYFFAQPGNSWQFKATACFQLSIDLLICVQWKLYRGNSGEEYSRPLTQDEGAGDLSLERQDLPRESLELRQ